MAKTPAKKKTSAKRKPAAKPRAKTASKAKTAKQRASKPKAAKKPEGPFEVDLERNEPRGIFAHIWEARRGLGASFEAQIKQGVTEERLLFYVAFACLMAFVARLPTVLETSRAAEGGISPTGLVAGSFVAFVIFAPLFLYGIAGLSHLVSQRIFGGQGSYPHARMALFWSLILAVPIGLVWALVVYGLRLSGADQMIAPLGLGVFCFWLWIWTSFLAISEDFSRIKCFLFVLVALGCLAGLAIIARG